MYLATATASAISNKTWVGSVCARGRSESTVGVTKKREVGVKDGRGRGLWVMSCAQWSSTHLHCTPPPTPTVMIATPTPAVCW